MWEPLVNIVAKGGIAHDEQFHLLSQCFLCCQKVSFTHKQLHHCCYLGSIRDAIEMPYGVKVKYYIILIISLYITDAASGIIYASPGFHQYLVRALKYLAQ